MAIDRSISRDRTCAIAIASLLIVACGGKVASTKDSSDPEPRTDRVPADWTMLGYDLGSTYWNKAETKIHRLSVQDSAMAWAFDTKSTVTATPVISGGRVYVVSQAVDQVGGVTAIDLATGVVVWHNASFGGSASPALDGDTLYVHDTTGFVRALNAGNGEERWAHKTDEHSALGGFSSPIVTKDFVLVGGSGLEEVVLPAGWPATFRGFVIALHKHDGALAWKKHTVEPPSNGAAIWSTLSVDETSGVVVAATGNNYTGEPSDTSDAFLALPLSDGANFLWKQQIRRGNVFTARESKGDIDADFGANAILFEVDGRKLAAGGNKGGDIWVLDRSDGSIVSQRNFSSGSAIKGGVFNNGAWDGQSLLFAVNGATSTSPGSEPGGQLDAATLYALDPLTLDVRWERQVKGPAYSPISVANGVGFFGKNTTLQAFDTATGEVLMEYPTEGTIATAPALSDGYVVFGSGMGWLQASAGTKYYALKVP